MGHYLVIQRWRPEFIPTEGDVNMASVCIYILKLQVEYCGKNFLRKIAQVLGRLIKIDAHILKEGERSSRASVSAYRERLAICNKVDLQKSLILKFEMNELEYKVE